MVDLAFFFIIIIIFFLFSNDLLIFVLLKNQVRLFPHHLFAAVTEMVLHVSGS